MAKSRKKTEVAYKDTFEFKCFPEYKYTVQQKTRFVLFQGRVEHWRAAINYADNFVEPDKINLLYMLGYDKGMHDMVMQCESNLVILCAKIPRDLLRIHDEYWSWVKQEHENGRCKEDGSLENWYIKEREDNRSMLACDDKHVADIAAEMCKRYDEEDAIIEAYENAVPKINKYYERYTIIDKLHPEKTIDHKDLDKIIKRYYPFGREQCKIWDGAYKGGKAIDNAIECGLQDGDGVKFLRMPPDDKDAAEILRKNVKRLEMNINTAIRERGQVSLVKMYDEMRAPPWGWSYSKDACAAFCLGKCMSKFIDGWYISDSVGNFEVSEYMPGGLRMIATQQISRRLDLILSNEDGWHLSDRVAYIFGIESSRPFGVTLMNAREAVARHTCYPIDQIDHKLYELLRIDFVGGDDGCSDCGDDDTGVGGNTEQRFDPAILKGFQKYLTWDKCEELRQKYLTINEDTEAYLGKIFPGISFDKVKRKHLTLYSGWLYEKWNLYLSCYLEYFRLNMLGYADDSYSYPWMLYGSSDRYRDMIFDDLEETFGEKGWDRQKYKGIKHKIGENSYLRREEQWYRRMAYDPNVAHGWRHRVKEAGKELYCPYCKSRHMPNWEAGMFIGCREVTEPDELAKFNMSEPGNVYSYICSRCYYCTTEAQTFDEAYEIAVGEIDEDERGVVREMEREKLRYAQRKQSLISV